MLWELSGSEQASLFEATEIALLAALRSTNQHEPQLVANMVFQLPKALNEVTLSAGRDLQVGGVFVHAQPRVKCENFPEKKPRSVELSDLLLVRTAVSNNRVIDKRAMLLQAKMIGKIPSVPDNKNQYHLYSTWPEFSYTNAGPELNGQVRDIRDLDIYNAAKYLLIQKGPLSRIGCLRSPFLCIGGLGCKVSTARPTESELSGYSCFIREFVEFVAGNAGRRFEIPAPENSNGWDKVIEDLLVQTAKRESAYTETAGVPNRKRGHCLAFATGQLSNTHSLLASAEGFSRVQLGDGGKPPDVPSSWGGEDDPGGISAIELVVTDGSWERRK